MSSLEDQILNEMTSYDYDTLEYPIEVIVDKYKKSLLDEFEDDSEGNVIYVPDYQREYVWSKERKAKFIESILIGVPIPYFFFADVDGRMEIVDGSQRIRTLNEFVNGKLKIKSLEKLTLLNGKRFSDLTPQRKRRFLNKGMKVIFLSEKTDIDARADLFERINTGTDELTPAEVRKGSYSGPFYDFILTCSQNQLFEQLCPISAKVGLRAEGSERVLRFFAYTNSLKTYKGTVRPFLNKYLKETTKIYDANLEKELKNKFELMLNFVDKNFPYGFKKKANFKTTPRVRFEAIAVGVSLALEEKPTLDNINIDWLDSDEFKAVTRTDAANNTSNLMSRINFVKEKLIKA